MSDALLAAIEAELDALARDASAGFDIAPARRARVEGMATAALRHGSDAEQLVERCRRVLPADSNVVFDEAAQTLRLDIWQRRAPVEPTTRD